MPITIINKPNIRARKMQFDFKDINTANFWGGNSIVSSFFAVMSATFPPGEKEFIESVRLFKDRISNAELQKEIKEFIGQEGQHSFQHRQLNYAFDEQGWNTPKIEAKVDAKAPAKDAKAADPKIDAKAAPSVALPKAAVPAEDDLGAQHEIKSDTLSVKPSTIKPTE